MIVVAIARPRVTPSLSIRRLAMSAFDVSFGADRSAAQKNFP
jgi:hypothetical protein